MSDQLVIAAAPLVAIGGLLAAMAFVDLIGRERMEVSGGWKAPWVVAILVIPVGPIVYLWFGRKVRPRRED